MCSTMKQRSAPANTGNKLLFNPSAAFSCLKTSRNSPSPPKGGALLLQCALFREGAEDNRRTLSAKRQQHGRGKGRANTKAVVNEGVNGPGLPAAGGKPRDAGRTSAPTTSCQRNTNEEERHARSLSKTPFIPSLFRSPQHKRQA